MVHIAISTMHDCCKVHVASVGKTNPVDLYKACRFASQVLFTLQLSTRPPDTICPASNTEIACVFALLMYFIATASYLSRRAGCDLCLLVQGFPVDLLQTLTQDLTSQAFLLLIRPT